MLDVNLIRTNPEAVRAGIKTKNADPKLVDQFLKLDTEWRELSKKRDDLRAKHKKGSGPLNPPVGGSGKQDGDREALKKGKEEIQGVERKIGEVEGKRDEVLREIPNIPDKEVPTGGEEKNKVLREWGTKPKFDFEARDYVALGESLDLIDTAHAAKASGSRFGYLKREAALLEFALIRLAFHELLPKGFIPVMPPVLVKPETIIGMGKWKFLKEDEMFHIPKDNLYLVGSAEHSLGALHMDDVLKEEDLPLRYLGFSTAFRREAGSYGKDTRGVLRVHQFDKLEMFSFTKPEDSEKEHSFLVECQEVLMQKLGMPYRAVLIASGDMGWSDTRQYDIEAWFPAQKKYRETHSCSNTSDYQARGLNIKYRKKDGALAHVHTLNGTAFSTRPILAILENYQIKEGTIKIPKVLQSYVGVKEIKRFKN